MKRTKVIAITAAVALLLAATNLWGARVWSVIQGGTGTLIRFTQGSVVVAGGAGVYVQDNANFFWDATNHRLGLGTAAPTILAGLGGNVARVFGMERHTTANTAGNTLTVRGGGATSGATNKNGGGLILAPGTATGSGSGSVMLQAAAAGDSGTTDRTAATTCTNAATGFTCTTPVTGTAVLSAQTALSGTTPTFDAGVANSFKITLTGNTTLTLTGGTAGQMIGAIVCQDGTGSRTWAWPSAMKGGFTVTSTASKCDAQLFLGDGTYFWATSAGKQAM